MQPMKHKTLLRILTVILFFTTIVTFIVGVGAGGVLNDLDEAYEVMVELEQTERLQSPPDTISKYVLNDTRLFKNSAELKGYINEIEQFANKDEKAFYISIILFISLIIVRIGLRLRHRRNAQV